MDDRYYAMRERFKTLSYDQLRRMRDNIGITLFDTYNYHEGKYCPIAIALNLHQTVTNPTQDTIKEEIGKYFSPSNMLKGLEGQFYHGTPEQRKQDLLMLIDEILNEK